MNPSREQLEKAARRALSEAKDPRKAAGLVVAGTAAAAGIGIRRLRGGDGATFESDAYRLLACEPVAAGMKRILTAQVGDAIAQLRGEAGTESADAIHEAAEGRQEDPLGAPPRPRCDRRRRLAPRERALPGGRQDPEQLPRRRDPGRGARWAG